MAVREVMEAYGDELITPKQIAEVIEDMNREFKVGGRNIVHFLGVGRGGNDFLVNKMLAALKRDFGRAYTHTPLPMSDPDNMMRRTEVPPHKGEWRRVQISAQGVPKTVEAYVAVENRSRTGKSAASALAGILYALERRRPREGLRDTYPRLPGHDRSDPDKPMVYLLTGIDSRDAAQFSAYRTVRLYEGNPLPLMKAVLARTYQDLEQRDLTRLIGQRKTPPTGYAGISPCPHDPGHGLRLIVTNVANLML